VGPGLRLSGRLTGLCLRLSLRIFSCGSLFGCCPKISAALKKRAAQIQILLMDVDGTMTEAASPCSRRLTAPRLKSKPSTHTMAGLDPWRKLRVAYRLHHRPRERALLRRAHEMKMEFIYMKQPLKMPAYEESSATREYPILESPTSAMICPIFP